MIGKTLGGRYEVIEQIGGGGMALVYKCLDLLLNRKVAIKVLRSQFVHDEEFIRRFRREAQAAASLSHLNVVSIYDVGQEGDIHYIVMEYIDGTNLNEIIKERAPLPVEEAIHYSIQICDALGHAHHNEIIHRDIKPHNILIGKNGRVKVTDFGIARAVTSSTITQTGSVVGSVHYFSPEHAKGTSTGEKSDLYSLGIVMYQMLTGQLPFLGESPISVALKHLQEDVEDPRNVNPAIPQSVENIILKSMRKKPSERYDSAREMMQDLETCLTPERRNEPKISFWDSLDEESTRVVPAIRSNQTVMAASDDESQPPDSVSDEEKKKPVDKTKKKWTKRPGIWITILLILLVLVAGLAYFVKQKYSVSKTEEVPFVENLKLEEAVEKLKAVGFTYEVKHEFNEEKEKDVVFKQDPKTGEKLEKNSKITLYVSDGPELKKMPALKNSKIQEAKNQLLALGIKEDQITITNKYSDSGPDVVLQQTPAANEDIDPKNAMVKLTVSNGKKPFNMPNLEGLTLDEAKTRINLSKLKLDDVKYETSYLQPKGKVIKQFPYAPNDEVTSGAGIKLIVSSGLPEEAGEMMISLALKPSVEVQPSTFKIIVSDATRSNYEYKTETVTAPEKADVKVVVSPDKEAVIQVKENDKVVSITTRTYQDYLNEKNGRSAQSVPSAPIPSDTVKTTPTTTPKSNGGA
ncbi:Stk1 family PASTA domain-containing Ser/Thr kinase [Paenibacillus larvae]